MLIDFFYTLRSAKLKVSVKEYLTLLEALRAGVIGPSVDDFYYLARTALVKDEAHYDKFDRAFAAYFKGVELLTDFTQDVPLEWLRKTLELELSPEEKAAIEKMGWDELMETLKKRFEEQKERHEGGSKMIGTGGTSPFGAYGYNPQGIRIGQAGGRNKSAVKVWDQRAYKDYDDTKELGTRNIKVALRRLRRFAREGAADELDLDDTIHCTAANAGMLDIKMVPERHNKVKVLLLMDVGGTMDEHIHRVEELFSATKTEFKHLEFYYFHNCVYDFMWKNNRRRYSEKFATWDVIRKYNKDYKLIFVGDATMSPYEILQPGGSVEYNNEEAGADLAAAADACLPQVCLDQPRAAGRVAVPAEHFHRAATAQPAHVPAHAGRAGRRDALAEQMTVGVGALGCWRRWPVCRGCASLGDRRRGAAAGRHRPKRAPRHAAGIWPSRPRRWRSRPRPSLKALLERTWTWCAWASRARRRGRHRVVAPDRRHARQVRSLLQTEGYFSRRSSLERRRPRPGQPDLVRLKVEPGQRAGSSASRSRPKANSNAAPVAATPTPWPRWSRLRKAWPLPRRAVSSAMPIGAKPRTPCWPAARGGLCQRRLLGHRGRSRPQRRRCASSWPWTAGRCFASASCASKAWPRTTSTPWATCSAAARRARHRNLLLDFQERLQKSGLFENISVTLDTDPSRPPKQAVVARLQEAALQVYTLGLGFSANTRERASVEHLYRRVFGFAAQSRVKIELGAKRQAWDAELSSHPVKACTAT
jgi:uncharacterized protein with von Willebrand factor type A (vWA) domain